MEQKNIKRMPTHCGDKTCPSCVVAGDYIYLAHHAGGFEKRDIKYQMRAVFEGAIEVFNEYFDEGGFPARMTSTSEFLDKECLCMIDGVAYKKKEQC